MHVMTFDGEMFGMVMRGLMDLAMVDDGAVMQLMFSDIVRDRWGLPYFPCTVWAGRCRPPSR